VSIEASHNYQEIEPFLDSVYKILKNEGLFLYADYISLVRFDDFEDKIKEYFDIVKYEDIREKVVYSMFASHNKKIDILEN
jgi:hypothetical protein